jgi:hypothetical protein
MKSLCRNWTRDPKSCRFGQFCHFSHVEPLSDVTYILPSEKVQDSLWKHYSSITKKTGATFSYSSSTNRVTIQGSEKSVLLAHHELDKLLDETEKGGNNDCCSCFENPKLIKKPYGLLKGCEHVICYPCAMEWRKNQLVSRQARLGCPVCREFTGMIVPHHKEVHGNERLKAISVFEKKCGTVQCKWAARKEPCPAGKYCLYNHSRTPQVIRKTHARGSSEELNESSNDELTEFRASFNAYWDGLLGESLSESSDDELTELHAFLEEASA